MSYTIRLEDERGTVLDEVPGATVALNRALAHLETNAYPWLATLEPYGDSSFNRLQVPHLIRELRQLCDELDDAEAQTAIKQTPRLAERAQEEGPNRYLRFYGD
jgi:hypothetical protein